MGSNPTLSATQASRTPIGTIGKNSRACVRFEAPKNRCGVKMCLQVGWRALFLEIFLPYKSVRHGFSRRRALIFPGEGHLSSKQFALSLNRKTAPIANWSLVREHSRVSFRACGIFDPPRFPIRKLKVRCALPKPRVPIPSLHPGQFGPNQPETLLIAG